MREYVIGEISVFDEALIFATKAHAGVKRKGSGAPYIVHPIETAAIAATMTEDVEILAAAVLHDVIEDTPTTAEELRELFGERITALVEGESENKRRELPAAETWVLRKSETIDFLKNRADRDARILALSDKLSNLRAISRDMRILGDAIWNRFNQKNKAMHAWMYCSIGDALSDLSDTVAWQEYENLLMAVFGMIHAPHPNQNV